MKLSMKWLGDHVDLSGFSAEEIAQELTMKCALIEELVRPGEELRDVHVGHVLERRAHPDADRLSLCRVDTGKDQFDVVCGAPNVDAGQKIAYAGVGAVLPGGLRLESRKIRGVVSHGMICSERELGLGEGHEGILVLDENAEIGQPLVELLDLDDVLFDIDNKTVTHRADLWGHYGFARELSAILGRELRPYQVDESLSAVRQDIPVQIDDLEGCPRYLAWVVENIPASARTPDWMQRRLLNVGMRPIRLLVDLSNYLMLDLGQPTHPFDLDKLASGRIVVRRARDGETLATLDGQERGLTAQDLLITDGEQPLAIAGVMGGTSSEVSEDTQRMLLEAAAFDAISVRGTSSRLALRTDAVARFEKFLDPHLPEVAVRRFAWLLRELCPEAKLAATFAEAGEARVEPRRIAFRPERARSKLGFEVGAEEMSRLLRAVGFGVESGTGAEDAEGEAELLHVDVPSFRAARDINHEDDIIEEVGRLAGYDRVPAVLPKLAINPPERDALRLLERQAVYAMVRENGYTEVLNYSFASDRQVEFYHDADEPFVRIPNPITSDTSRLRRSLVPGILEHLHKNQLHREQVRLLEVGRCYLSEDEQDGLPGERRDLVAVRFDRGGFTRKKNVDPLQVLLEARADVERLFQRLGLDFEGLAPKTDSPPFAHPGRCIELSVRGRVVGHLAQLHPRLEQVVEIEAPTAILRLHLDELTRLPVEPVQMKPIPQFPAALRDLAVEAPDERTVAEIVKEIRSGGQKRITAVDLFDIYRGQDITAGHRSLAFRLEFRVADRTLKDDEVERILGKVVKRLARIGVRQRG